MSEYVVEAKHVCKSFRGIKALDDVYFNLKSGEVMALLGEKTEQENQHLLKS